jgi:hypothetical protein
MHQGRMHQRADPGLFQQRTQITNWRPEPHQRCNALLQAGVRIAARIRAVRRAEGAGDRAGEARHGTKGRGSRETFRDSPKPTTNT